MGPASEWPAPPIYAKLSAGLRKAAGLSDGDLEISVSHVTMDATEPYVRDEEGQRKVREGAMRSLDARGVMLDGLYRAVYREPAPVAGEAVREVVMSNPCDRRGVLRASPSHPSSGKSLHL